VPVGVVPVPVGVVAVPLGVVGVPDVPGHGDGPAGLEAVPAPPVAAVLAGWFFAEAAGTPTTATTATIGISERMNRKSISLVGLRG
jgi:hypothetical protein